MGREKRLNSGGGSRSFTSEIKDEVRITKISHCIPTTYYRGST